ncbi:SSI family serine proteinase inhibitor [Streptomyces tailanensis]|uniref:SSI family serine proteinase inhibitor n=1 Tax=Streptomyces tailanensis TaxID=2569858 RepID=UPI00122DE0FE|nr:SSI family serine proteinase inhibitor [Streptomyces tailanensis]
MTNTTRAVRGGLLAALVLLPLASSAPARATFPDNWLYVTVTRGDARTGDTRGSLLLCDPPQGHTRAAEACAELRAAGGDITRIPQKDGMCVQVYAPIRATAHGEWNGRPVEYEQTFANGCVMTARTGAVFALPD